MTSERQEEYMNEIYEVASWDDVERIANGTLIRWSEALELLARKECENGECPECAAKQVRGH